MIDAQSTDLLVQRASDAARKLPPASLASLVFLVLHLAEGAQPASPADLRGFMARFRALERFRRIRMTSRRTSCRHVRCIRSGRVGQCAYGELAWSMLRAVEETKREEPTAAVSLRSLERWVGAFNAIGPDGLAGGWTAIVHPKKSQPKRRRRKRRSKRSMSPG